jgi:hypothetical protein
MFFLCATVIDIVNIAGIYFTLRTIIYFLFWVMAVNTLNSDVTFRLIML